MRRYLIASAVLLFSIFLPTEVISQSDSTDLYELTLTQLSALKIFSATKAPQSGIEIPSSIVVTADEIREKGYFTIEEALSDLPGFQFRNIQELNSYVFQRGIPNILKGFL